MQVEALKLGIHNETDWLISVVLGTAESTGPQPDLAHVYDPSSRENLMAGTYPVEEAMKEELLGFETILKKHGVEVYRPEVLKDTNQIFVRDIAFVIDNTLFRSNILPLREGEFTALSELLENLPEGQVEVLPEEVHVEGGDVMPWNDYIFVGTYTGSDYRSLITARTNAAAVDFLKERFPSRRVMGFDLVKSETDPERNALHLDCCFQPVGQDLAIIAPKGFQKKEDCHFLKSLFPEGHVFEVTPTEMARLYCNVFSISPEVVVSEAGFDRLNDWLREKGLKVETLPYAEISKLGGLLRCTTLPLRRVGP